MLRLLLFLVCAPLIAEELTFADFDVQEKERQWWREAEGVIIGGSSKEKIRHNTFITTKKRYANFELNLQVRLVAFESKNPNAGIQIRSERVPDHHEMIGYQADMAKNYWAKLYDESRRRKIIGNYVSPEAAKAVKEGWNDYKIRCEGPRIRLWLNGVLTVDYVEKDAKIPLEGLIALQAHSGPTFEASYRKIEITELPETAGIQTWKALGEDGVKLKK